MAKTTTIVSIKHYYIEPYSSEYWMTIADEGPASPLCALERYVGLPPYLGQPWAQRPWWTVANNTGGATCSSRRNGVWSLADPAQTSFLLSWFNTSSQRIHTISIPKIRLIHDIRLFYFILKKEKPEAPERNLHMSVVNVSLCQISCRRKRDWRKFPRRQNFLLLSRLPQMYVYRGLWYGKHVTVDRWRTTIRRRDGNK